MSKSYTVKWGDTLSQIAVDNKTSVEEILKINPEISNPDFIRVGQVITIPVDKQNKESFNDDIDQSFSTLPADAEVQPCPKDEDKKYFIAVADRSVDYTGGLFFHYSVQFWESSGEVPLREEMTVTSLNNATKINSIELLRNDDGWNVYVYNGKKWFSDEPNWQIKGVSLSVIFFSDRSTKFAAIYKGEKQDVEKKWRDITKNAKNYGYAEQGGGSFNGRFFKWPDSKYQMPGDKPFNNSNTFIRNIIMSAGCTMMELKGSHPGNASPSKIPNKYSERPWKNGETPPPVPKTHL